MCLKKFVAALFERPLYQYNYLIVTAKYSLVKKEERILRMLKLFF